MTEKQKPQISYEDFEKLDLRVAKIIQVEDVQGADKLYKLEIDLGKLGKRTLVAGIKQHYSKQELVGKKIIIIANLEPRKLKSIESQGMLLAAFDKEKNQVVLIEPEKDIENGVFLQ